MPKDAVAKAPAWATTLQTGTTVEPHAHKACDGSAYNLADHIELITSSELGTLNGKVFEDTILESNIRAERSDKAQDLLNTRLKRLTSPRDELWLTRTMPEAAD